VQRFAGGGTLGQEQSAGPLGRREGISFGDGVVAVDEEVWCVVVYCVWRDETDQIIP
jgi:hypothetical protein